MASPVECRVGFGHKDGTGQWFKISMTDMNTASLAKLMKEFLAVAFFGVACCAAAYGPVSGGRNFPGRSSGPEDPAFAGVGETVAISPSDSTSEALRDANVAGRASGQSSPDRAALPCRPVFYENVRAGDAAPAVASDAMHARGEIRAERRADPVWVEAPGLRAPRRFSPANCKPDRVNPGNHGWFSESNRGSTW